MDHKIFFISLIVFGFLPQISCGVRGDPKPPKEPTFIGRGKPTFSGATQNLNSIPNPPIGNPTPSKDDENEN